jgi:VWFA-related protein
MPRADRYVSRINVAQGFLLTFFALVFFFPGASNSAAQQNLVQSSSTQQSSGTSSASTTSPQNVPEMTSQESAPTFQVNVRLVEVRVVVRDAKGKAVGTLHKDDFRLLDNGKPQTITKFSIEQPGVLVANEGKTSEAAATENDSAAPNVPERYVAYLFDDVHMVYSDLIRVWQAADKNLDTLRPTDRAAIYTISGQGGQEFTDDHAKLREALRRLTPHPLSPPSDCPKMTYYLADAIENNHDDQALTAVTQDVLGCQFGGDPRFLSVAQQIAQNSAVQGLSAGDAETNLALASITNVVRRMLTVPGQRTIVLASPGFITPKREYDVYSVIDRAVQANIIINALDARGLYTVIPGGDISETSTTDPLAAGVETLYQSASASSDAFVMSDLADGTGGYFFHNNNGLEGGLARIASAPEYYYVLGFSPQSLKVDGKFHHLKVTIGGSQNFSIQARKGYFAPKESADPEKESKQEIQDALFSQEELHDLPIALHTQFFKSSELQAKLTVLAHIDLKELHFRKADGRNNDNLTIVSGIFDGNGNFVSGIEKTLQMHLRDETLAHNLGSGLSVKSDFDLKPGSYLVRLVVRDERGQIAAENGAVRIP